MHPNKIFRQETRAQNIDFARERGFGSLMINGEAGPLVAHVPFLLEAEGNQAELHLVRSNPIARRVRVGPVEAVIAVNGPDGYVSPDWYGVPDQVPTWNYIAVHLRGTLMPVPEAELHAVLDRLSAHFEDVLRPKTPWVSSKMSDGVMERMMRAIVPFKLEIAQIEGTWKLGQNKPDAAREGASDYMAAHGVGLEPRLLAALMRGAKSDPLP